MWRRSLASSAAVKTLPPGSQFKRCSTTSSNRLIVQGLGQTLLGSDEAYPSVVKFMVNPEKLDVVFDGLFKNDRHVYCKGAVHEGKSSFAKTYVENRPGKACYVGCNTIFSATGSVPDMEKSLLASIAGVWPDIQSFDDLHKIDPAYTILFDECHTMFPFAEEPRLGRFVKRTNINCRVAYLSTTQYGMKITGEVGTPPSITNKVVLPWRFTRDEVAALMVAMLVDPDPNTKCTADSKSVDMIFSLFQGHRGMTVLALLYLDTHIPKAPAITDRLDFVVLHEHLCTMLRKNEGFAKSRAVKINGNDGYEFPNGPNYTDNVRTLIRLAVSSGLVDASTANKVPVDIQKCVTLGALSPTQLWNVARDACVMNDTTAYTISNPFLLEKLTGGILGKIREIAKPTRPVDAVISGLSHISYMSLFNVGTKQTMPAAGVWFEDPLNVAIAKGMEEAYKEHGLKATTGYSSNDGGKPDIIFGDFVIEGVVYPNSLDAHYNRFTNVAEYMKGTHDNHLFVIYCSPEQYQSKHPRHVKQFIKDKIRDVPILVVCVNFSSVWNFETYYYPPNEQSNPVPLTVKRNYQVYVYDSLALQFSQNSIMASALRDEVDKLAPVRHFHVQVHNSQGKPMAKTDVAHTLKKEGLPMTVDGLKKAVKKELEANFEGQTFNIFAMTVYEPGETKGKKIEDPAEQLVGTISKRPYHVTVSK